MNKKILDWLANGETGISSRAIAYKMLGVRSTKEWDSHPKDPDDFRRCLLLVDRVPGIRKKIGKMRRVSRFWRELIDHWDDIEKCFKIEVPNYSGNCLGSRAPMTYDLMQKIYENVK